MPRPLVNGLSPQIVFPGSKLTIRGENLGNSVDDIINLWICGEDCKPFIDEGSQSDTKIICHVGKNPREDDPEVIVVTKSGGEGECNIKLSITNRVDKININCEVPLWMEEVAYFNTETVVVNPRDQTLALTNQKNLFGATVPFKSSAESTSESDPSSNTFDPIKYLLHNHRDVTISDLQGGLSFLEEECGQHTSSDIEFVKTHIDVLLACHDTLQEVNKRIDEEEERATGGSLTGPLDTTLNECNKCAELLFSSILNKKDKADRIRNALNVIERFRFLFGLPDSIDKNINSKAYDIVLNDYKKAKSLFGDTQVHVFQQVMDGVHGKIRTFSKELQARLLEPRCPLNEKKQLLKYLVEFEGSSSTDPAWDSLQEQQQKIIHYLTKSKMEFKGKLLEIVKIDQIKAARSNHRENSISPLFSQFIDELCDAVTQSLPDYWSLCQSYLDGSLLPDVKKAAASNHQIQTQESLVMSPPPTPSHANDRLLDRDLDVEKLISDVLDLLSCVIRQYCIDMDFKFSSENDVEYAVDMVCKAQQYWTPSTVKRIKMCVERLLVIGIPISSVHCTINLVDDMQNLCVKCLFKSTECSIRELHTRENWEISQERGHTALPLLFQNMALNLLSTVKEVMEPIRYKEQISDTSRINNTIQDMFYSVVISFADCLKNLTDIIEQSENGVTMSNGEKGSTPNSHTTKEERLVLILGNCRHTILTIIPTLLETFKSHGYISANDDTIDNKSLERYSNLERSIFDKYVNSKDAFLFGDIAQFLEPGSFPWAYCNPPASISIYVQELALKLVMAQAELHNIEKDLLKRIIGHLLENVTVKVCSMISQVDRFCKNGVLQAKLDISACLLLFRNNMTSKCKATMNDTLNSIPTTEITPEDEAVLSMLLEKFKAQNSVLLSCLDYAPEGEKGFSPGTVSNDSLNRRRSQKRIGKKGMRSPPLQSNI